MKKIIAVLFVLITYQASYPQIIYYNKIDSLVNIVSLNSILKYNRELSGDTLTTIGGLPYLIYSRFYSSPSNAKAAQYIYEKFQSFGLNTRYQNNNSTNINVIGKKTGSLYPNQYIIVSGHYDNYRSAVSGLDTVHGADDNASGTCGVLESARLLANFNSKYTLLFIAFDEEELGLFGSMAFVDSAYAHGDSIVAVFNMDMIAWDGNNDFKQTIMTDSRSDVLANEYISVCQSYSLGIQVANKIAGSGSDHWYFWQRGYKALTSIEYTSDFNPYYHTIDDNFSHVVPQYFLKLTKAAVATVASWAVDYRYYILHTPVVSSLDTSARTVDAVIRYPIPVGTGSNAPRLYYKTGNGNYNFVNAFSINGSNYSFRIPGQPAGSKVTYYIAAQDSTGNYVCTYPSGGSGSNPPGTTPPASPIIYYVLTAFNQCSNTVPKPINNLQITQDTIVISQTGMISDVNINLTINHTNDGDLLIMLVSPNSSTTLTQYLGEGGQNYINTTFDDSASIPITAASPPFTGTFRPIGFLSVLNNQSLAGKWILKIFDKAAPNTGSLISWCLNIKYTTPIGINENISVTKGFTLYQNYPNPFNPSTKIKFEIPSHLSFPHVFSGNPLVTLKVYDITGREIQTLINEQLHPGTYETEWDGSNYPSGIYFYKLTSGEYTETKKMLMIK